MPIRTLTHDACCDQIKVAKKGLTEEAIIHLRSHNNRLISLMICITVILSLPVSFHLSSPYSLPLTYRRDETRAYQDNYSCIIILPDSLHSKISF